MARGRWRSGVSSNTRRFLLSGVALAALLAVPAPRALAQQAQSETSAPAGEISLDDITVIATLTEERAVDALAGVSVVRQDDLTQLMPDRIQDAFFGMPGTTVIQNGNSPQAAINIRGMQDFGRVAVIIDGARQNFTQLGHGSGAGTFFIEPDLLTSVDVVRGPVSNIYGSGAIGGVVSFRTKDAADIIKPGQTWGIQSSMEGATNGPMGFGSLYAAGRYGQNVDVFLGGTYRAQSDYKDGDGNVIPGTGYDQWTGIAKITARPADFHEVKLSAINFNSTYTTYDAQLVNGAVPASSTQYATDVTNQTVSASWNYSNPDDKVFDWRSTVYWNQVHQDQTKVAGSNTSTVTGPLGAERSFNIETIGFDANNTSRFDLGPVHNAVTLGGDYFHDDVVNIDPLGFGDGYNPSGQRGVGGAFVQWQGNYSTWLQVVGALRYDAYNLSGEGTNSSGERLSPKVTVGITPWSWLTFYGTYAEGYRAPSVTETLVVGAHPAFFPGGNAPFEFLPNPNLQPEVGKNKEIGLNIKYDDLFVKGDKLRAKANVYRNDVDDYIELVAFGPPICLVPIPIQYCPVAYQNPYSFAQYQNISQARLQGFEFEGNYDAGLWFAGFSATVSEGEDTSNGEPLANVMPNNVATTLGARFLDNRLTVSLRWQWVAAKTEQDLPSDSPFGATPSFNLVNAYIGYQPSENVLASFSVENLLNEQYTQYQQFLPSAGITAKAALRLRFASGDQPAPVPAKYVK